MDKKVVVSIMKFMMRVRLEGHEVPNFNIAMLALEGELGNEEVDNESKSN